MLERQDAAKSSQRGNDDLHKMAIIDVGSNSFRLIVITYRTGYHFQVTDEVRETVRLAHGISQNGLMQDKPMDHAVETMRLYASFCKACDIDDIRAVATSAVREAKNSPAFLRRVKAMSGIDVRVLSGEEEAYYGYLAAENSTTLRNGFVIDLGGGSLEITRVDNRQFQETVTLTLGALRATEEWLPEAPASKPAVARFRKHIREQLEALAWFDVRPGTRLVGLGGSLRNVTHMAQKSLDYPMGELHGFQLRDSDLRRAIEQMEYLTVQQRMALPGMKPDRADIALAGAIVIEECMKHAGYDRMTVCAQGLREGVFYEGFLSTNKPPIFEDVRRASVMNVAHLYQYQQAHVEHVERLAIGLFDQLRDDPLCGLEERQLLWAACTLHDIGMTVDYNDHHRHGYYLVLNSGLPGYSHRELALIALTIRFHRKGMPYAGELASVLQDDDDKRLLKMTALLRLAEQLDRSRDGAVQAVRLATGENWARIEIISQADVSVAIWSAERHTDIFEQAFGKRLEFVQSAR
ncbi:MAG TPA: Ppx/GppA phosphatase family protein [Aggregatilineales bacterium]|nr:Ppx/GppA phosphatase family protein [Aggregatilineales bacterium]